MDPARAAEEAVTLVPHRPRRPAPRPHFAAAIAACLGLLASLPAQDPPAVEPATKPALEPPTANALLQRLAARDVTIAEAQRIAEQLQPRALPLRMQCFDVVQKKYAEQLRTFSKLRERVQKQFAKAVPKAQQARLGRGGAAKVEELRSKSLAITRGPDLTKERIRTELDPMLQQLRELLLPTPEQVCAEDNSLQEAVQALRQQLDTTRGWFDLYLGTMHEIDQDPVGRRHVDGVRQEADPPTTSVIDDDLELQCLAALPLGARDSKTLQANEALRASMEPEEFLGTLELNRIRIALGLPTLRIDEKLGEAARDHSLDMRTKNFFSHTSPVEGKHSFTDRASLFGTSASAENIAAGQGTGAGAIRAWWYSPGHHTNMLGGHSRTGLGRSESLWTQMFGG
ncbi:MAG: CAP domain-containing protein [Planctomycetes bacterium]|nr:CAP domain-containing protein [Planctomycetota bacterium]